MAEAYSLLEFLQQLSLDDGLRAAFTADPQATLGEHGLAGLTTEDVHDAAVLVADTRTADFSLHHTLAPDPAAGFLDAFLPGEPSYLPSDLGEGVDLADVPADVHTEVAGDLAGDITVDVPAHVASFGTGHAAVAAEERAQHTSDDVATAHHTATFDGYDEHFADLDEHADPDLDDLFVDHTDPAAVDDPHHAAGTEPPAH